MPKTIDELKNQLSAIEPNVGIYDGIGPSEIPILEQLLKDKEAWMASRAVFALSRIRDPKALSVLSKYVEDPRPEVRVAIAASIKNLKPNETNNILLKLLDDTNLGVRKFSIQSTSLSHNKSVHAKVRKLETQDPSFSIRDLANNKLRELKLIGP